MRPLTDHTPKPLLEAGGKRLIEWHLEKLAAIGVLDVVINISHLAEQFPITLGDGSRYGLRIHYSHEGTEPLETGGGLLNALSLLNDEPFLVINGDVWTDLEFAHFLQSPKGLAHLVLVDNPSHHNQGDFGLDAEGLLHLDGNPLLTFSGIGIYRHEFFAHWQENLIAEEVKWDSYEPPRFPLAPLLRAAIRCGEITGQHYKGVWTDVGTPERLNELDIFLKNGSALMLPMASR